MCFSKCMLLWLMTYKIWAVLVDLPERLRNKIVFNSPLNSPHLFDTLVQGESLARGPKLLSMYTVEQRGFLIHKYWQTGSFKACQTAFRTEFGERCAPTKCCIQKLVKKLETRRSRSNSCRLLFFGAY